MNGVRVFEYVDGRGEGVLTAWLAAEADQGLRAKVRNKLNILAAATSPNTQVMKPIKGAKGFWELRVTGPVQWRPIGFYGPGTGEFTFVRVYQERDGKFPKSMAEALESRRREVVVDPARRRAPYDP